MHETTVSHGISLEVTYGRWDAPRPEYPSTASLVAALTELDGVFLATWALGQPRLVGDYARLYSNQEQLVQGHYPPFTQWVEHFLAHPLEAHLAFERPPSAEISRITMFSPLVMVVAVPSALLSVNALAVLVDLFERVQTVRLKIELEKEELRRDIEMCRLERSEFEQRLLAQTAVAIRHPGGYVVDAALTGEDTLSTGGDDTDDERD